MVKRAQHRYFFGRSHCEVTPWLTRKFQPACRYFRGGCTDERGAVWKRVSGPFQSRSAGANSRKATNKLSRWQAFVANVPDTAILMAGLWEEAKDDAVATRRGGSYESLQPAKQRIGARPRRNFAGASKRPLRASPKASATAQLFQGVFHTRGGSDLGQSSTGNLIFRGGANLGGTSQAASVVGVV